MATHVRLRQCYASSQLNDVKWLGNAWHTSGLHPLQVSQKQLRIAKSTNIHEPHQTTKRSEAVRSGQQRECL